MNWVPLSSVVNIVIYLGSATTKIISLHPQPAVKMKGFDYKYAGEGCWRALVKTPDSFTCLGLGVSLHSALPCMHIVKEERTPLMSIQAGNVSSRPKCIWFKVFRKENSKCDPEYSRTKYSHAHRFEEFIYFVVAIWGFSHLFNSINTPQVSPDVSVPEITNICSIFS